MLQIIFYFSSGTQNCFKAVYSRGKNYLVVKKSVGG